MALYEGQMKAELFGYVLEIDENKTRETYQNLQSGGCVECGCAYCKNYQESIPDSFPTEILDFFNKSGIDIYKDAEVYHYTDLHDGVLNYGGEYYLCGKVITHPKNEPKLNNNFTFVFTDPSPLIPDAFKNTGSICFSFSGDIKWVL